MSQLRRRSLDSKLNMIKANRKESESETLNDKKLTDKSTSSAESLKTTGATHQTSIKEQLKPKTSATSTSTKNNKHSRENTVTR